MKHILVIVTLLFAGNAGAQNIGIGIATPSEILHVDSTIKIGKDEEVPDSSRKNLLKFGDGGYVTIGEEYLDDQMNIKFGNLIFSKAPGSAGSGYIGLFTTTPTANLDLNGSLRIRNINAAANRVLTCLDANGNATWGAAPGAFTLPYTGTNATAALAFKVTQTASSFGVADLEVNNTANPNTAVLFNSNGTGTTLYSQKTGTGGGAIVASTTDATNTSPALTAESYGTGDALTAVGRGTASGAHIVVNNAGSTAAALVVSTNGTGTPLFVNGTSGSTNIAVFQTANSTVANIDKNGKGYFNGGMRIQTGNEATNRILISTDNAGNADWQPVSVLMPAFRAYLAANTSMGGALTTVTGYTESHDDASAFNPATGIFTVPSAGLYSFTAAVGWGTNAAGTNVAYIFRISVNYFGGGTNTVCQITEPLTALPGYGVSLVGSGELKLSTGDQVRLEVSHSFGSPILVNGGTSTSTTFFEGHKIY